MKDIIGRLNAIEKEILCRKDNDNLSRYNSGDKKHLKQIEFHKCKCKNRWVFGGNRTGKTECGAVEVVYLARGIHPYRENKTTCGWVVSLSKQVQRDVAQAKILHYLRADWIEKIVVSSGSQDSPDSSIIDFILVKNVFGGISKIGFKSCDQGREKFQGASLDYVWFDEEPPYEIYQECRMRVLDRKGDIFGTMTPLKGLTWVYNQIYLNENNDSEVWYEQMEWADNPYLDEAEVQALSNSLSAEELDSRRYGRFMQNGGLVYPEFDVAIHVIDPFDVPLDWQDNISIDPGLKNPLSAHWYCQDYDGNVYVVAEHFASNLDVCTHANKIKEICDSLNWKRATNGMIQALIDSAAQQRTLASSKSVVELFYHEGIIVNPHVNKDLFSGISVVKRYLKDASGKAHLFIFKNCINMINELKSYWWGNDDAPIKKDDHCLDELRYYLMSINGQKRKNLTKNGDFLAKNKEKMIKKLKLREFF